MRVLARLVRQPLDDYQAALERSFTRVDFRTVVIVAAAFAASWWAYVPIHELAHALGCWLGGGEVTRLEIAPVYGAALLQRVFPFVAVGSDYAGQLTGFDTGGSDLTYMLTDFLPFVLTIVVGVPLLRWAGARASRPRAAQVALGVALPIAYAPFISLVGDYYEMGSIIVSRVAQAWAPEFDVQRWRSDDLFKLAGERIGALTSAALPDLAGIAGGAVVGTVLAFLTYGLGTLCADHVVGGRGDHEARG